VNVPFREQNRTPETNILACNLATFSKIIMAKSFDPYREALVVEESTVWSESLNDATSSKGTRESLGKLLHQEPALAAELEYARLSTGFQRIITVTAEDLKRLEEHSTSFHSENI
jgi:hypothetical protein